MKRKELKMKNIFVLLFCFICFIQVLAQTKPDPKKTAVGIHFFYNDFQTANRIKTTSLGDVLIIRFFENKIVYLF